MLAMPASENAEVAVNIDGGAEDMIGSSVDAVPSSTTGTFHVALGQLFDAALNSAWPGS